MIRVERLNVETDQWEYVGEFESVDAYLAQRDPIGDGQLLVEELRAIESAPVESEVTS